MEHLTDEQMAVYASLLSSGQTKDADPEVAKHIQECDVCASQCVELSLITEEINSQRQRPKLRKIGVMVASVAAALLIPLVVWLGILNLSENDQSNMLSSVYEEDIQNEKLVADFNGAFRGQEITVNTQGIININDGEEAVISWSYGKPLTVDIVDNTNTQLVSETVNGNSFIYKPEKKGLYYWKLYNSDFDLLYCGKLIVK